MKDKDLLPLGPMADNGASEEVEFVIVDGFQADLGVYEKGSKRIAVTDQLEKGSKRNAYDTELIPSNTTTTETSYKGLRYYK